MKERKKKKLEKKYKRLMNKQPLNHAKVEKVYQEWKKLMEGEQNNNGK